MGSSRRRIHVLRAVRTLDSSSTEFRSIYSPVVGLVREIAAPRFRGDEHSEALSMILAAQVDIVDSMRAIYKWAEEAEAKNDQPSSMYTDSLLLARPALELSFIGLLLLLDPSEYLLRYRRSAWRDAVISTHYTKLRYENDPATSVWWANARDHLEDMGRKLGLTEHDERAVIANFESSEESREGFALFPTPWGGARFFREHPLKPLADEISLEWKFSCEAAHVGWRWLIQKQMLRDCKSPASDAQTRARMRDQYLAAQGVVVALVSILALATAVGVQKFDDVALIGQLGKAWGAYENKSDFATRIWQGWAKSALRVLG